MNQDTHTGLPPTPETLTEDYAIWLKLKPYIGHCLSMNHDLNNPLAGILGYCEFMLTDDDSLTATQRKHLQLINKCAERMKLQIEALCEEKIALSEGLDLRAITDAYKQIARKLE
jgi:signal transduction histidine kinase